MASKSRGNLQDWDPMRDDFDNSNYDPQYPDEEASSQVNLDHCRLYLTNIPKGLNDEGLRAAFAKYGTLMEVYVNKDPTKRYGLVSYETAGEARQAMMKLNRTEPLKLNISIAHKPKKAENKRDGEKHRNQKERSRDDVTGSSRDRHSHRDKYPRERDDCSVGSRSRNNRKQEEMANGDNNISIEDLPVDLEDDLQGLERLDPELQLELEQLQLEQLKLQQAQLQCKQRIILNQATRRTLSQNVPSSRCVLPGGKVVVRNMSDGNTMVREEGGVATGAGDSNEKESCSCKANKTWEQPACSSDAGSSTPSTCVLCSEDHSDVRPDNKRKDKSDFVKLKSKDCTIKTTDLSRKSMTSKTTDLTSKKSDYSKYTDTYSKRSEVTSKKLELVHRKIIGKNKSDVTCDLKFDFYSDSEDEADETNRLIQLRNSDYMDIVDDNFKIVIALAGYPKSKMRLRQMELFQRSLSDVMDMQMKAGLLQKLPAFLDYYLNRGAIVCICKDLDTRDWVVRISPGLQERMRHNLILLKSKVKRLCLAVLKIPRTCWPASAHDAFKLLQYFNPTLKTDLWRIYAQKTVNDIECTSFLIDRVSGEIIRGPCFKNIIDYNQMEFELTGYTEIYYQCLLSDLAEDLSSLTSRAKLLEDIKSQNTTPRNMSGESPEKTPKASEKNNFQSEDKEERNLKLKAERTQETTDFKKEIESACEKEILKKLKDVKYISDKEEVIIWSDETNYSDQENEKTDQFKGEEDYDRRNKDDEYYDDKIMSSSGIAVSEKTESLIESNDNLTLSRNSNLNIDSNRGIAYHRRTNYLHVEQELKIAITLEGYPQNKLEGTHIRRLKHLFKEYLHKDMKNQRFANLIIPKFQDIYLSNGAVIYICDSMETKDYLNEVLPKFVNSTGLKLTFRDIKKLVRYTRIVMRLPKEHANVESVEILLKLQAKYPQLKPDCWKYYSDVAGKQKRQFGVDPMSLEVIKSPDFEPTYEGEKISFRIIDRQKRDNEEPNATDFDVVTAKNDEAKKIRDKIMRTMYVPIDSEIMNAPLTRIRTNHYSDLIADDLKLYVGPSNYPESRIEDNFFHSIKRTFENIVFDSNEKFDFSGDNVPKFHDIYLFDGVIFIICQNMASRRWIEQSLTKVNSKLHIHLKSTEFRGAVGIVSMVVKTDKGSDEIISILQKNNPRLRTKYWRKISTVRSKTKLDVVLQIDKLSAQVITGQNFNKFIGSSPVQFKLGHLQSLLKPKSSLEELSAKKLHKKASEHKLPEKSKSKVSMQGPKEKTFEELKTDLKKEYPALRIDDWNVIAQHEKANHKVSDLEIDEASAKIIEKEDFKLCMGDEKLFFYTGLASDRSEADPVIVEPESPKSINNSIVLQDGNANQDLRKMILKIPVNILPENKDDLSIIFDLLEDKNPGLNTELWQVFTESQYPNNGKFTLLIDRQSASVIQGGNLDPTIGGEKLKFFF